MRRFSILIVAATTIFSPIFSPRAQDLSERAGIGIFVGGVKMVLGKVDHSTVDQWAGVSVKYGFNPHFAMAANAGYGWVYPRDPNGSHFKAAGNFKTLLFPFDVTGIFHFFPQKALRPYISFGGGLTEWNVRDMSREKSSSILASGVSIRDQVSGTLIGGVGIEAILGDRFGLSLSFRYHQLLKGNEDTMGTGDDNRGIIELRFGLMHYFGGFKDSDGDGIEDKLDADPSAAEDFDGYQDADGAPDYDNDSDSIPDSLDLARNEAEDFDGFQDDDGVPDPDNDGDGIPDIVDKAPNAPEDFDGFQDKDGVPDLDNDEDGIPDKDDKCPDQAETFNGYQDEDGCPDEKPAFMEKKAKVILRGVSFASGSAQLLPEAYRILDTVYESLAANTEVEVEIRGYTDSVGPENYNLRLSQRRADAVKQYLVNRGIDSRRIRAVGYGESSPVASNATAAGRTANRRIEFIRIK